MASAGIAGSDEATSETMRTKRINRLQTSNRLPASPLKNGDGALQRLNLILRVHEPPSRHARPITGEMLHRPASTQHGAFGRRQMHPVAAGREWQLMSELGRSPAISDCPLPASISSSRRCPEPTTSHGAAMSRARRGERVSGVLAVRIAAPYRSPSPMRVNHACRRSLNGEQRAIGRSLPRTSSQLLSQ